jgi:hypothetical protein
MTLRETVENLLWEDESSELDFKSAQYPFAGASDDDKSEILKDLLAFGNAWRRTEAYILIGVEEVRGARSIPRGISDHLGESHIQQLVNSKTNRPLSFSYKIVEIDGASVGVLRVPVQDRPIYATKTYGRVKADTVYIRRGSSTDIAKPDEIARMTGGAAVAAEVDLTPEVELDVRSMKEYVVNVFVKNEGTTSPKNFRVDVQVPDDFAVPTANFEREVRHADGYRYCQTGAAYVADGIFQGDRVLVQRIQFNVAPSEPSVGHRLQKTFKVVVHADGMASRTFEQPLWKLIGFSEP